VFGSHCAGVYNVRKFNFQANLCEYFAKTKRSIIVETFWDGEFCKRLFSTISEQHFNQNVEEVAYSIYLAVY